MRSFFSILFAFHCLTTFPAYASSDSQLPEDDPLQGSPQVLVALRFPGLHPVYYGDDRARKIPGQYLAVRGFEADPKKMKIYLDPFLFFDAEFWKVSAFDQIPGEAEMPSQLSENVELAEFLLLLELNWNRLARLVDEGVVEQQILLEPGELLVSDRDYLTSLSEGELKKRVSIQSAHLVIAFRYYGRDENGQFVIEALPLSPDHHQAIKNKGRQISELGSESIFEIDYSYLHFQQPASKK